MYIVIFNLSIKIKVKTIRSHIAVNRVLIRAKIIILLPGANIVNNIVNHQIYFFRVELQRSYRYNYLTF